MLTLLRFHLWRKQSMDCCRLVALLYVTFVFLCVHSLCMHACVQAFLQFCLHAFFLLHIWRRLSEPLQFETYTLPTQHTPLHLVSICMHYVLGIASVSLCWSRQSWARPTDNHEEEETEELRQQRQQQCGHHRRQKTQPRHQLQPLQSGTCKHQLHSVCLFYFFSMTSRACLQAYAQALDIPNGTSDISFNLFKGTKKHQEEMLERKPVQWKLEEFVWKHLAPKDEDKIHKIS